MPYSLSSEACRVMIKRRVSNHGVPRYHLHRQAGPASQPDPDDFAGEPKFENKQKGLVDDKAKYTDWSQRDDIKAELKVSLIILLANNDYPPVDRDEVYKEIFEQAQNFKKHQAA